MKRRLCAALLAFSSLLVVCNGYAQERLSVFISDLHLGLGRTADGSWHPYEDFRWPQALKGFLSAVSKEGNDTVDLIIVGDFLELWQLPDDIHCEGSGAGAGCSVPELVDLTTRIIKAHDADLQALKDFSVRGTNRLYLVPGNHDAALLIPAVRAPLVERLGAQSRRVIFVESGLWVSEDKRVVAEHGHQIGSDVNAFAEWPKVTTTGPDGKQLMIRPWGERFVQQLFNEQEMNYPIIDNLNPETAGARYRMSERGLGGTLNDLARFIAFNIFETTPGQKYSALSTNGAQDPTFDRGAAVKAGYLLFSFSLPDGDSFKELLKDTNPAGAQLRSELNEIVKSLPSEDLEMLCRNAVVYTHSNPCNPVLSALVVGALVPKTAIFQSHLRAREEAIGPFDLFVYGHTHRWESRWKVPLSTTHSVTVVNTGAFQRLVDEEAFLELAAAKAMTPEQALRKLRPEDLKPCYSAVFVRPGTSPSQAELRLWEMPESGGGRFRAPGVADCR
ncbi:hypothetical protein ACN1C3_08200 [Pseudomonas sp. H11T01]|uniref:hypothetical protein n=1 Tax=Pseudomonas sp. H11T01 TaxID=3402749 RepID=UPI003AC8AB29